MLPIDIETLIMSYYTDITLDEYIPYLIEKYSVLAYENENIAYKIQIYKKHKDDNKLRTIIDYIKNRSIKDNNTIYCYLCGKEIFMDENIKISIEIRLYFDCTDIYCVSAYDIIKNINHFYLIVKNNNYTSDYK